MEDEKSNLLTILNHMKKRPGMYFGETLAPVDNFVWGFFLAAGIWGKKDQSSAEYNNILKSRGLHRNQSVYEQLREQGHSHDTALEIYMDILIELYTDTEG